MCVAQSMLADEVLCPSTEMCWLAIHVHKHCCTHCTSAEATGQQADNQSLAICKMLSSLFAAFLLLGVVTASGAGIFWGVLNWFWIYKLAGHVHCIGWRPLRKAQPYFQPWKAQPSYTVMGVGGGHKAPDPPPFGKMKDQAAGAPLQR